MAPRAVAYAVACSMTLATTIAVARSLGDAGSA